MFDTSRYIGLPYRVEGRGPTHYDCWGLVRLVYEDHFGIVLPIHTGYTETMTPHTAEMIDAGRQGWSVVEDILPLDVVLFNVEGEPNHIGIVISSDLMLHTTNKTDACIENFRRPVWSRRLESFYRYDYPVRPSTSAT